MKGGREGGRKKKLTYYFPFFAHSDGLWGVELSPGVFYCQSISGTSVISLAGPECKVTMEVSRAVPSPHPHLNFIVQTLLISSIISRGKKLDQVV